MVLVPYDQWCTSSAPTVPEEPPIELPADESVERPLDTTVTTKDAATQTEQLGGGVRPPPGLPATKKRRSVQWIKH